MYLGNFDDKNNVERKFGEELGPSVKILLAVYFEDGPEGDAFVLFEENGKLYEVNASHCSCFGLEGQWEPELTSTTALRDRMLHGLGMVHGCSFSDKLIAVLTRLERAGKYRIAQD